MNIKKAMLATILLFSTQALSAQTTIPGIQLKVEVGDAETVALGMTQQEIEKELTSNLTEGGIPITTEPTAPTLMLRFKSVQAANVVASFVQLAFLEEAELVRGKSHIQAITWSQATLLTTPKEAFVKDTTDTIDLMIKAFIKDYKKAFPPQTTTPAPQPVQKLMPLNTQSQMQQDSHLIPEQAK
jgi:hypothetical protein